MGKSRSTLGDTGSSSHQQAQHHRWQEAGTQGTEVQASLLPVQTSQQLERLDVILQLWHRQSMFSAKVLKDTRSCEILAARGLAFNERDPFSTIWSWRVEAPTGLCSNMELRILRGQRYVRFHPLFRVSHSPGWPQAYHIAKGNPELLDPPASTF